MDWSWAPAAWDAIKSFGTPGGAIIQQGGQALDAYTGTSIANANLAIEGARDKANADLQREFAQQGIRWRVEDAKAAGIHPLYALGASGASAAPSFSVQGSGQDLSRAIHATRTGPEREFAELQLQRGQLENLLLGLQVFGLAQSQFGPKMPTALEDRQPNRATVLDPSSPGREAGSINDLGYIRKGDNYYVTPAKDAKERTEDNMLQEALWAFRNQLIPLVGKQPFFGTEVGFKGATPPPPSDKLKPGHRWQWNGVYYKQVKK